MQLRRNMAGIFMIFHDMVSRMIWNERVFEQRKNMIQIYPSKQLLFSPNSAWLRISGVFLIPKNLVNQSGKYKKKMTTRFLKFGNYIYLQISKNQVGKNQFWYSKMLKVILIHSDWATRTEMFGAGRSRLFLIHFSVHFKYLSGSKW